MWVTKYNFDMNGVVWNVRGMNKPFKQKEVSLFLKKNKISFAGLLETRVKTAKANKCFHKIARDLSWDNNYQEATNGCIWIRRRDECVDVQVLVKARTIYTMQNK